MSDDDVTITKSWTPYSSAERYQGLGYIQAEGQGATVVVPVSREVLDDEAWVEWFSNGRLRDWHQMEVDRLRQEATP